MDRAVRACFEWSQSALLSGWEPPDLRWLPMGRSLPSRPCLNLSCRFQRFPSPSYPRSRCLTPSRLQAPIRSPIRLREAATETEAAPDAAQADPAVEAVVPDTPPAAPEVTTSTQSDGGNVNVSVRVNSPGEEAPVVQEGPDPAVVSPPAQPDITPVAGILAPEPDGSGSTGSPAGSPATPTGDSTNTNVSVRVSSPGDNDPVTQTTASGDTQDEPAGEDGAAPGDTAASTPDPPSDSSQYQDDNSQYQSTEPSPEDAPWNWTWTLTVCDGNVLSDSDETGSNSSRDWTWNWVWNWTCDEAPASNAAPTASPTDSEDRGSGVPQPGPANVNVSIRVLSPGDDGPVTQTNTTPTPAPSGSGDPSWMWSWTFTWCGTTTEISTLAGEGTGLDWDWNWLWLWDCGQTGEAPPAPDNPPPGGGGGNGSGPPAETPAPPGETPPSPPLHEASDASSPFAVPSLAVPESLAEWVPRVSWVTPRTSGFAFPAWLTAPRASSPDTTPWEPVQLPALPAPRWPTLPGLPRPPLGVAIDIAIPSLVAAGITHPSPAGATATRRPDSRWNDRDRDHHDRRDPGSSRTDA